MRWKTLVLVVCLAIGAILAACGPTPDPKDIIECDAVWGVRVYVWLNENANGIRDEGEKPLPSVTVNVVDAGAIPVDTRTTASGGVVDFYSLIPCWEGHFEVYAEIPPGYRLTTEPRVRSSWTAQGDIHFGFIRDPRIPKGAKEALDRYYRDEFYVTEYSLVSAQQATQVVGIDEALRSQGVTPHGLSEVDEAWCVATDPVVGHEISFYCGPNEEDWEGMPSSPAIWDADVILITRCGSRWWAGAVWDYFSHDEFVGSDGVAREVSAVLQALGCE